MLAAGIVAFIAIASGAGYFLSANRTATVVPTAATPAEPARLSIVVLPFTNLSNDPSQDYFADGVTENLTTELSRIHNSFVIARNTAFSFKGKNVDAREIGKELGVRYVLEGSVQRDQNRVRVNAQLIDAGSGAHLWADRFEEDVADLFKLQDQVVARLANSLGYELVKTEAEKDARSKSPDAVDLAMRGWALVWQEQQQQRTKENNNAAQALFEQALKIDPNETDALAGDAYAYLLEYTRGWATTGTDYEAKILGQADRAIALAPDNVWAYNVKSLYLTISQRANEGLSAADAGLAINPDDPPLHRARGTAEIVLGRYEQAISDVQQAIRLSPRDPRIGLWLVDLGNAELGLGHFDAAVDEYRKAIDAGWRAYQPYRGLAAAYALDGQDGRGDVRSGGGPPPQSRTHHQMVPNPFINRTAAIGGPAQGGAAGGVSAALARAIWAWRRPFASPAGGPHCRPNCKLLGARARASPSPWVSLIRRPPDDHVEYRKQSAS